MTAVRDRPAVDARPTVDGEAWPAWGIGGVATVALRDDDPAVRAAVRRALEPYEPARSSRPADLELVRDADVARLPATDVIGPAGDGVTTVSDGERLHLVLGGRRCALADPWRDDPIGYSYEPGFPVARLFGAVVRPALQVALHRAGASTLHASAVELDGRIVLVAGWSETGKTEVALALVESGGRFVSDKWSTVRRDGRVVPFPIGAGIRRWLLPYAPILRRSLPARGRAQFAAARLASAAAGLVRPVATWVPGGTLAEDLVDRSIALADRLGLGPNDVRRVYDQRPIPGPSAPLAAVVLLRATAPGSRARLVPITAGRAVERLVRSAAFERRPFAALEERAAYAFPGRTPCTGEWSAEEGDRLRLLLASVPVYEVLQPFPGDPRPAAELVERHVG